MTIKRIKKKFFLGTTRKEFASFMVSHMYVDAHEGADGEQYFFMQKLGFFTYIRLTLAFFTFSHLIESKILARIFREVITEKEYQELRLHMVSVLRQRGLPIPH